MPAAARGHRAITGSLAGRALRAAAPLAAHEGSPSARAQGAAVWAVAPPRLATIGPSFAIMRAAMRNNASVVEPKHVDCLVRRRCVR